MVFILFFKTFWLLNVQAEILGKNVTWFSITFCMFENIPIYQ